MITPLFEELALGFSFAVEHFIESTPGNLPSLNISFMDFHLSFKVSFENWPYGSAESNFHPKP